MKKTPTAAPLAPIRPKPSRPSTRRGRAAARAVHGLRTVAPVIPGVESEDDWLAHLSGVIQSLRPVGQIETLLAERAALNFWRLKRVVKYETQLVTAADPHADPPTPSLGDDQPDASDDSDDSDLDDWERRDYERQVRAERILRAADDVLMADDSKPVSQSSALAFIASVNERTSGTPLSSFSVPDLPDTPLDRFDSWTAGLVRRTIRAICERFKQDPEQQIRMTVHHYREAAKPPPPIYDDDDDEDRRSSRKRVPTSMPLDSVLERIIRYEAHISRELHTALHDLEVWQTRRLGKRPGLPSFDLPDGLSTATPDSAA